MKRKLLALITAIVLGIMCTGALAACGEKPTPPPPDEHVCGHVCPVEGCGKCLDATCTDPVCADKCPGHGTPTPPPPDEHVCGHVCPEDGCGKCLDATCTDPVCADKCEGHGTPTPPPPDEHVCGHVCPEDGCGKCLDSDCTDPVCADKCEGHVFTVTFDLDGGTGTVSGASYEPGDTFDLPAGEGLSKEACTLTGWNDGTTDYELGAQYRMPAENVVFTAVWEEWTAYEFGVLDKNVSFMSGTGGKYTLNEGHIGNVAKNFGSVIVFDVTADKAGTALLYFTVCDRQGEFTFDDAYVLKVNGQTVQSSADMSQGAQNWENFRDYLLAEVTLGVGSNTVAISVKDTGEADLAGNVKGITLKSETVVCSFPDKEWDAETVLDALSGSNLNTGVHSTATVNGGENCLGQMNLADRYATFRVKSDADTRAALYLNVSNYNEKYFFDEAFDLYINGKRLSSGVVMPSGRAQWTDYDLIRIGLIGLDANEPTEITLIGKEKDYNIRGIKLVAETACNIALTDDARFGYASSWNNVDIAFVTADGGSKSITQGVTVGGGVTIDNGGAWLGGISGNENATISFTVNAEQATRSIFYLDVSYHGDYLFNQSFELYVNGDAVFSCSRVPTGGTVWTQFADMAIAEISLDRGDNTIEIRNVSSDGGKGCNIAGASFKSEAAGVTLKS